jgi:thiol-disulfide isomerase/thioredoxin
MPTLDQISKEYATKNVLFVGIGIDSPSNIREFLQKTLVSYPIVIGGLEGSNLAKQMGNSQGALPYTIIISPSGKSTFTKLGKISEDELKKAINSTL